MNYEPHYKLCDDILRCINQPGMPDVPINNHLREPLNQQKGAIYTLRKDGYIFEFSQATSEYLCRITTKGVAFIESGGYRAFLEEQQERKEIEQQIMDNNLHNATFQKKYGNLITGASVIIAFFSAVTSVVVTVYIAKEQKPPVNQIIIRVDSTLIQKPYQEYHDSTHKEKAKDHR